MGLLGVVCAGFILFMPAPNHATKSITLPIAEKR